MHNSGIRCHNTLYNFHWHIEWMHHFWRVFCCICRYFQTTRFARPFCFSKRCLAEGADEHVNEIDYDQFG